MGPLGLPRNRGWILILNSPWKCVCFSWKPSTQTHRFLCGILNVAQFCLSLKCGLFESQKTATRHLFCLFYTFVPWPWYKFCFEDLYYVVLLLLCYVFAVTQSVSQVMCWITNCLWHLFPQLSCKIVKGFTPTRSISPLPALHLEMLEWMDLNLFIFF